MMLAMRGGLAAVGHCLDEDGDGRKFPQKYDIFRLSSMVCQLDRKPFFATATSSNHTF